MSPGTPLSPLTPLSQLLPLVQLEQIHTSCPVVSTPAHLPSLPDSNVIAATTSTTITCGFDPACPRNRQYDPPRSREKNLRWTELQRGLASKAESPSSLQALESEVRLYLRLSSYVVQLFVCS